MPTGTQRKPTKEQIHETLWRQTAELTGKSLAELRPDHTLIHDLGMDSLDVVELSMAVEDELGLQVREDALAGKEASLDDVERLLWEEALSKK